MFQEEEPRNEVKKGNWKPEKGKKKKQQQEKKKKRKQKKMLDKMYVY